jgi:hypothetical protein
MRIPFARHVIVDREHEALSEQLRQTNDIRRRVLQVHNICPANGPGQILVGTIAKFDRLALEHRLKGGLPGKIFRLLETNPDLEIRFISNCGGYREDESFNAAIRALARTNEKQFYPFHIFKARATS